MDYPFENKFRAAPEIGAALSLFAGAGYSLYGSSFLHLGLAGQVGLATALAGYGAVRWVQGREIQRFVSNLSVLPKYELTSDEIPWHPKETYLGMGFDWGPEHTQRLYLARKPYNKRFGARSKWRQRARAYQRKASRSQAPFPGKETSDWISKLLEAEHWLGFRNPVAPLPPVGGDPAIHGIEPNEYEVWFNAGERVGHHLVLGTTRVGKTRLCELLVTQDIRRGATVIVFDPKGDQALLRRMYAEACRAGREKDFYMFHLGFPEQSARYNPVGMFAKITEVATRIAGQLPGEGQSATFKEFVWRFVNVMAKAASALGQAQTYASIYRDAANIDKLVVDYFKYWLDRDHRSEDYDWRDEMPSDASKEVLKQAEKTSRSIEALKLAAFIRSKGWSDPIGDALASILGNDRSYFEKLVSSLYPLLEKLTTGPVAELLNPSYTDPTDPRPIFTWQEVISRGGIVYVGLDSLSDFEVAGAVGSAMFSDLTSVAGQIYKFGRGYGQSGAVDVRPICVHGDEFNELIGDAFIPLLNKAGGAGVEVTVYTQTWDDVEAKIGSKSKAGQIGGNLNTLTMMRVKNKETAEILTNQLPQKVTVSELVLESRTGDINDPTDEADFTSMSTEKLKQVDVPLIEPTDLVQLPKGQAFSLVEGGRLVKVRLPLALEKGDIYMPDSLEQVCSKMQSRYSRYVEQVESSVQAASGKGRWLAGNFFPEGIDPHVLMMSANAQASATVQGALH